MIFKGNVKLSRPEIINVLEMGSPGERPKFVSLANNATWNTDTSTLWEGDIINSNKVFVSDDAWRYAEHVS